MMLERNEDRRRRTSAALGASLALHLVFLALIPSLVAVRSRRPSIATLSFARIARIELTRAPRSQPRHHSPRRATIPTPPRPVPAKTHPRPKPTPQPPAPFVALVRAAVSPSPLPSASASPSPGPEATGSAAPVRLASTERLDRGGYLPFGAQQLEPVIDARTARRLRALGLHASVTVRVDGNGRVLALSFSPPIDAAGRTRVLALLAEASWDPAVCGGYSG